MPERDWRGARERQKRDIKESLERNGMTEREADKVAEERSNRGMERAVNVAIETEGDRPSDIRSK